MSLIFWSALILQIIFTSIDEFYFHWQRNLPRWERWGHPVDTFFFLLPLLILSLAPAQDLWVMLYVLLSALSCFVITKDEWVHRTLAGPLEHWMHSLLFVLHPVVLFSAYFLWRDSQIEFLWIFFGVFIFWLYQLIFWNLYADRIFKKRLGSY